MVSGVNLRLGRFRRAVTDDDLAQVIARGIPPAMPSFTFSAAETTGLIAFIRAGFDPGGTAVKVGNVDRGRTLFATEKAACATCHRVRGEGPRAAPDLSDIGAVRTPAALQRSLLDPTRAMLPINRPVTIVTSGRDDHPRPAAERRHLLGAARRRPGAAGHAWSRRDIKSMTLAKDVADAVDGQAAVARRSRRSGGVSAVAARCAMKRPVRSRPSSPWPPLLAAGSLVLDAQVTSDRLLNAVEEPHNWLTYNGTYTSQRYSPLDQITPANVTRLESKWVVQNQVFGAWQSNPLVVDGVMYLTQRPNDVMAVDARTGSLFWIYRHTPSPDAKVCCGANNRGVAILGDTLFMGTLDARLIAIDAKTGKARWNIEVGDVKAGYSITMAPLVVKDKVHRRRRRRRVRHPRLRRRLRREDRQGSVAVLHDSRPGRARPRHLGGRRLEDRRRAGLGDRLLRSGAQPRLLGHRQPRARLEPEAAARRQPLHRLASSRSTPTPAS